MKTITKTLSDSDFQILIDSICGNHGYQDTIDGKPNPETKTQFAGKIINKLLKDQVVIWQRTQHDISFTPTDITIS